jgi:methionyl-tRNA formyltransferase
MVSSDSGPTLRVVYFGTPSFAVPPLESLLASAHTVAGVVTQPDRPRGRGQRVSGMPVKHLALDRGLPVLQPERLRDEAFLEAVRALGADLGVVAAYGKILPDAILAIPRLGLINVHASLLPKYRGAAPIHRAIIAGERETGVTIMRIVRELDAGPVFDSCAQHIGGDETSTEVEARLARLGADLLMKTMGLIATGTARETPQDSALATYAPRLTKEDGAMDWTRPAPALHDLVRGLHPWPHAFTCAGQARYLIHRTEVVRQAGSGGYTPGSVIEATADTLLVAAGSGTVLRIVEIQPEGRRVMRARDFLAGHRLGPGARFSPAPSQR